MEDTYYISYLERRATGTIVPEAPTPTSPAKQAALIYSKTSLTAAILW